MAAIQTNFWTVNRSNSQTTIAASFIYCNLNLKAR